jgi:hypothetical protein
VSSDSAKLAIYNGGENIGMSRNSTAPVRNKNDPGFQKDRHYNWQRDPAKMRFGASTACDEFNTTKKLFADGSSSISVIPQRLAQHKAISDIHLGETKNLGFGCRKQGKDFVYGRTITLDPLDARALISGAGGVPDAADETLGRPVCRSVTMRHQRQSSPSVEAGRVFGVPTVRTDLRKPHHTKVTNNNNYGDDASAAALLYPSVSSTSTLTDTDFVVPRSFDEICALATAAQWSLNPEQLRQAFAKAANGSQTASIRDIGNTIAELGW